MTRQEVARNQRARIYGAMIESVARHGYAATTVTHLIGLAGVSRRAFYEHFRNKEQCLLATHNNLIAHASSNAVEGWRSQQGWTNQLYAACKNIFDEAVRHPKGAHFLLVSSLEIRPGARVRMQMANLPFERVLDDTARGHSLPLASCAIAGGVRQVLFTRLRERRQDELSTLAAEVLDWIEAYRAPRDAGLAFLRRSAIGPEREVSQRPTRRESRTRILGAMLELTDRAGIAEATGSRGDRPRAAGDQPTRRRGAAEEACFMAVHEAFSREALDAARASLASASSWPEGVHRAVVGYLDYLSSHERLTRLAFMDAFEIGPADAHLIVRPICALVELLLADAPARHRGRFIAQDAIAGAAWATIFNHLASGRTAPLSALAEELTFLVLAPYVGARAALEEMGPTTSTQAG